MIGYVALWLVYPYKLFIVSKKHESYFIVAGLCGITLYYLFENIALTYTLASNVGVIISIAPFFTAIISCIFLHGEHLNIRFIFGFVIAMVGICMISFNNETTFTINILGDILAVVAAIIWAIYSTLTKKISTFGYNTIQTTRRTFFYGLLFMIPVIFVMDFQVNIKQLIILKNLFNLIFLGLGASALCFVTWNFAVKILGSIKTSVFIYMVPVITAITSTLILHEQITVVSIFGIILTLIGLFISESKKIIKGE